MTTSDELKVFLSQDGDDEKNWKRLSKKKNSNGQWVRRFENKITHQQMDVTEIAPGKHVAKPVDLTAEANQKFAQEPFEVNEDVIDSLLRDGSYPDMPQDQADKVLASLYRFAVIKDEYGETDCMHVFLRAIDEANFDRPGAISSLMKGCYDSSESDFEFADTSIKTPTAAAEHMKKIGIQWDKHLQNDLEPSFTKELEAWERSSAKTPAAQKNMRKNDPKL